MNRRETLAVLALLGIDPVFAQPRGRAKPARIAQLPDLWPEIHKLFIDSMRERGWVEGRDYSIVRADIETGRDLEENARRIVAARPDLILATNTGYVVAALRLTRTTPIVMYVAGYPVEAGVARSYARPGGNVTGNSGYAGTGVFGKLLQLVLEAKPGTRRVGVLQSYVPPAHPRAEVEVIEKELAQAAGTLGLTLHLAPIIKPEDVPAALRKMLSARAEALFITTGPGLWPTAPLLQKFSVEHRILTLSDFRWLADLEPVLVLTPRYPQVMRQAVSYVDLILNGASPGDLPIQQPSKFDLILNLRTASAIGLRLPRSLLARADEVIE
jgi:putative ABC transport system substrate-binding protein